MAYRDRAEGRYAKATWREMAERAAEEGGIPMLVIAARPLQGDQFAVALLLADCVDAADAERMLADAIEQVRREKAADGEGPKPAA